MKNTETQGVAERLNKMKLGDRRALTVFMESQDVRYSQLYFTTVVRSKVGRDEQTSIEVKTRGAGTKCREKQKKFEVQEER